jgi:beta-mannosidase
MKQNANHWCRKMLAGIITLACPVFISITALPASVESQPQNLIRFDLGGQWEVSASGSNDCFAATVPGCIHTDLLAAKRIPDPFYRDNEKRVQWISELAWTYRRTFQVSDELLKHERLLLRCEGLDTLATVFVNGVKLGETDNMYRTWEFDVKNLLKSGTNSIEVQFAPVLPLIRAKEAEQHLPTWQYPGAAYVRKMPCNFGWDWGPTVITCGWPAWKFFKTTPSRAK